MPVPRMVLRVSNKMVLNPSTLLSPAIFSGIHYINPIWLISVMPAGFFFSVRAGLFKVCFLRFFMPEASQDEKEHVKALYNDGVPSSVISKRTGIGFLDVCKIIDNIIEKRRNFKAPVAQVGWDSGWFKKISESYQDRISESRIKHTGIAVKGLEKKENGTLIVTIYRDIAPGIKNVKRAFQKTLWQFSEITQCPGSFKVSYRSGPVCITPIKPNIYSRVLLDLYKDFLEGEMLERI